MIHWRNRPTVIILFRCFKNSQLLKSTLQFSKKPAIKITIANNTRPRQ